MRLPNIYDSLNFLDALAGRVKAAVLRRPYDPVAANTRSGVYAQGQADFDHIVQGGELVNRAPVLPGQPLVNVSADDRAALLALDAVEKDGKWYIPEHLDEEERWAFKQWFPKATTDLAVRGNTYELTVDGRSTNGYILTNDLHEGTDSTATSLVMAAIPVLFALGYALWQIPVLGPLVALGICGPLLALHMVVLYQAEDAGKVFNVVALGGGVPLMFGLMSGNSVTGQLNVQNFAVLGVGVLILAALLMAFGKDDGRSPMRSFWGKMWHAFLIMIALVVLNTVLGLLPASMAWFKPFGLFVVACAYPLYYTEGNHRERTAQLKAQSVIRAGSAHGGGTLLGKLAEVRMQQIRNAARDFTAFLPLGTGLGVMSRYNLASAAEFGQVIGLTIKDLMTHLHIFGATGTGKTSSILRPLALWLSVQKERIGMIFSDGKGAFVSDMRPLCDIVIEPGTKFAPFQGMDSEEITNAFAEAHGESMSSEDSIWVQGAGTFHRFALAILEALVAHEKRQYAIAEQRMAYIEQQIEYLAAEKVIRLRAKQDTLAVDAALAALAGMMNTTLRFSKNERQYRWTPGAYAQLRDTLATPVMASGGVWRASNKALALFNYLGYDASGEKQDIDPQSIHPDLRDSGRVLARAIAYFHDTWPNTDERQRSSFLINVNEDIQQFLKSDKLRGSIGGDGREEAWADTEEGVDILQVLYGKHLGINLPATRYGQLGKIIAKLVKTRIFREIRIRAETHGDNWQEATGQTLVMDMVDECQDMVSKMEIDLTATARSMGLFFVYATQNLESLDNVMPSDDAKLRYLNNFRSLVSFRASAKTYAMLQARAGMVKKKKVPVSVQATIDHDRAIDTYYQTIFADPKHPSAWALRDLRRRGAARFQVVMRGLAPFMGMARKVPIEQMADQPYIEAQMGGEYEKANVLEDTDLTTNLAIQGSALLMLNRASHDRIDFAKTNYVAVRDVQPFLDKHAA